MTIAPPRPEAAPEKPARRPLDRHPAAVVASAHRDAHGDRAAVPARAGRRPRLAAPAALPVADPGVAVLRRPPDARAGPRPAVPVRRLQLAVVRRDLPAAVRLADRLRAAAGARARPRPAGRAAARAPPPAAAAGLRRTAHLAAARRGSRRGRGGAPRPSLPRRPAGRTRCQPRRATSGRPATCCSTSPCSRSCSAWPAASCGATRAASWSPRARGSATRSSSTTPTPQGALVDSGDLTPLCIDLDDFRAVYEENLTAASFTADIRYGGPGEEGRPTTIGVNDPLRIDGDRVYVTGHGYSPTFSVTLPDGTAVHRSLRAVPALGPDDDGQPGRAQAARHRHRHRRPAGARGLLRADRRRAGRDPHVHRPAAARSAGRRRRLPGLPRPGLRHPAVGLLARRHPDRPRQPREGRRGEPGGGASRSTCPTGRRSPSPATASSPRCSSRTTPARSGCWARPSRCCSACSGMLLVRRERVFARAAPAAQTAAVPC